MDVKYSLQNSRPKKIRHYFKREEEAYFRQSTLLVRKRQKKKKQKPEKESHNLTDSLSTVSQTAVALQNPIQLLKGFYKDPGLEDNQVSNCTIFLKLLGICCHSFKSIKIQRVIVRPLPCLEKFSKHSM